MHHALRLPVRTAAPAGRSLAVLAGLLAAPAAAHNTTLVLHHPSDGSVTDDAEQVVIGQFSSDKVFDAALRHGTGVHYKYAVDRRDNWSRAPGDYHSIARLPKAAQGDRDLLLAVDDGGLAILEWLDGLSWNVEGVPHSGAWVGASDLQVVETPAGGWEVLAIDGSKLEVLRATWSTQGAGSLEQLETLEDLEDVGAVSAGQWDGDGDLEYAIAGPYGLCFRDHDGTVLGVDFDELGSGSGLLTVPVDGGPDKVAWLRTPGSVGSDVVSVVNGPTGSHEAPFWPGGADIAHLALVDWNGDGLDDLLLTGDDTDFALVLPRNASGNTFQGLSSAYILETYETYSVVQGPSDPGEGVCGPDYGASGPGPVPAVADLDGDTDDDILFAGHPGYGDKAMVLLGTTRNEEWGSDSVHRSRAWLASYTFYAGSQGGPPTFEFVSPSFPDPTNSSSPAKSATCARIVVWRQDVGQPMQDEPLGVVYIERPNAAAGGSLVLSDAPPFVDGDRLHLEVSYLERDLGGEMLKAFPAYHETFMPGDIEEEATFEDGTVVLWNPNNSSFVGAEPGGSSNRPPLQPPSGGGTSP